MKSKIILFIITIAFVSGCSNPLGTAVKVAATYAPGFSTGTPTVTPTVTAVNPVMGPLAGGTTITLTGTNFVSGATVTLGSQNCTSVSVTSSTELTCTTPSNTSGWTRITVTNPDTQTATLASAFDYLGTNAHADFGLASGGGIASSASLKLRGAAGGLASQIQPTGTTVRLYPGLINASVAH